MGKRRFSFYVIKGGDKQGIYNSWSECMKASQNQKGGRIKGFYKKQDAEEFLLVKPKKKYDAIAFTSGSFNYYTDHYSWCGIIVFRDKRYYVKGSNNDLNWSKSWHNAGKVKAVEETIQKAIELNIKSLLIYQDLGLIENIFSGEFQPKSKLSQMLADFFKSIEDKIVIQFEHKNRRDDSPLTEEAYQIAREYAGI